MNVSQLLNPILDTQPAGRKVSPAKLLTKAKTKASVPSAKALEITALRLELSTLTGAPVSPMMSVESLAKTIAKAKLPVEVEVKVEEEEEEVETKVRVIPAKAQGIGAHCVKLLKSGMIPKNVLVNALVTFPEAKTSMACVYWYASKIKQGKL